jgi:hypothetical protein
MGGGDPLDTCRNIPLDRVAAALGYRKDPTDRARFRREGSVISINGEKFFDHLRGTGGGGAIDLVIHATGCRVPEALRFLGHHEARREATPLQPAPRRLRLPRPSPRAWPSVRDALVRQRALRADVLEACQRHGLLYADDRSNAVFICRNASGHPTGAEILGTAPQAAGKRFRGMAPGSRKARGGFWLPCDRNRPALVILTESAVDAISARSLRIEETREHGAVVASTAGVAKAVPPWIEEWKPQAIICAYDADNAGDHAAKRLRISDPRVKRLRPHGAKDWNEILVRSR